MGQLTDVMARGARSRAWTLCSRVDGEGLGSRVGSQPHPQCHACASLLVGAFCRAPAPLPVASLVTSLEKRQASGLRERLCTDFCTVVGRRATKIPRTDVRNAELDAQDHGSAEGQRHVIQRYLSAQQLFFRRLIDPSRPQVSAGTYDTSA